MINNNLFNTDRGLIQADNGILRENINVNVKAPQLQQNPLQQFFEGPDVFGGFKVDNYANDLAFIKSVQNQRNETKELDSSLFAPFEGVDNDISQRMLIDDIKNSAVNYMAQEADDGMQEAHQSLINSNKFINQIPVLLWIFGNILSVQSFRDFIKCNKGEYGRYNCRSDEQVENHSKNY